MCSNLVLENIFRKPQLVDESSRILAGNVKVQFRYKHLSSIIFRPFDRFKITLRRFINISREAMRVDQVLAFENISTELAGKTLNSFKSFNTSKCLAMQIIVFGVGLKWEFHDDKLRV